jgi:anaerobic magnesium-protoporphyrin IX monomethyl ester cyclase
MIDVLLAHSNFMHLDPKQVEAGKPFFPLGTLYAASHVRSLGFEVALFDATLARGPNEFVAMLERTRPKAVVLYEDSFNWLSKMCLEKMRAAALSMLSAAKARRIPTLAHGSDVADHPVDYLRAGANEVALGEGELTVGEWVSRVLGRSNDPVRDVSGLVWLDEKSSDGLRRSTKRGLLQQLDTLPWPARDLIDVGRYRDAWRKRHGRFVTNLVTTRGCPYLCNWCSKPIYGNTYHSRSPEDVAREMKSLKHDVGAEGLWFADDILGLKRTWLEQFADAVEREGAKLPFQCQTRVDLMTEAGASAMARAGCAEAWLGVESGDQKVLDAMDKGITVEQVRGAIDRLRTRGVRVAFFLQFGYPGEDWPEIQRTRELVRTLLPDDIGISVAYPQPGTGFHEAVRARLETKQRWDTSGDLDPLFTGMFTRRFYGTLHKVVHAELRVARGISVGRKLLSEPLAANRSSAEQVAKAVRAVPTWLLARARLEVERYAERRGTPGQAPERKLKRSAIRDSAR